MSNERMHITIPGQFKKFAEHRVSSGYFSGPSDYVCHLIREDEKRAIDRLNQMIQEGIDSGISDEDPDVFFAQLHEDIYKVGAQSKNNK